MSRNKFRLPSTLILRCRLISFLAGRDVLRENLYLRERLLRSEKALEERGKLLRELGAVPNGVGW